MGVRDKCYATFDTKEQAAGCREAVFDLVWPSVGGRRLVAEFATEDEAEAAAEGKTQTARQAREEAAAKRRAEESVAKRRDEGSSRGSPRAAPSKDADNDKPQK